MALVQVLVWGLSGATGALVAWLAVRNRENRVAFSAVTGVVTLVVGSLLMPPAKSMYFERVTDHALENLKMYQAMKKAEPETYRKLRDRMVQGLREGKNAATMTDEVASIVSAMTPKYMVTTTNKAAIGFASSFNTALAELISSGGEDCYYWMHPQAGRGPSASIGAISRDTKVKLTEAMGEVITDALEKPQPPPSDSEGERLVGQVILKMQERGDLEGLVLSQEKGLSAEEMRKVCRSTQALYAELLSLPESERGRAIRYNFSGK